jgi:hypothetical protein
MDDKKAPPRESRDTPKLRPGRGRYFNDLTPTASGN